MLAIEHGIGEERDPVAQDDDAGGAGEHEVIVDVAMAKEEEVDVGMVFEVFLGKDDERLFVLAFEGFFASVLSLEAAALGPLQPEVDGPAWVDGGKELLGKAVVEERAEELEASVLHAHAVSVGQVEHFAVEFHGAGGLLVEHNAAFLHEIVGHPQVVVACEVVDFDAEVSEFGDFAQEAREASRHHGLVFVPKVEHVTQHVDCSGFVLDTVEEVHQAALLHAATFDGAAAEMGVR